MSKNTKNAVATKASRKSRAVVALPELGSRGKGFRPEGVSTTKCAVGSMRELTIEVLSAKKVKPMKTRAIFDAITAKGWTTQYGGTPVATLSTKLLALQRQGVVRKNDNAEYVIVPESQREKAKLEYAKAHPVAEVKVEPAPTKPTTKPSKKQQKKK